MTTGAPRGSAESGYETAVALWVYEGTLIWSKFNALLVANSIVLAVYGFSVQSERIPEAFVAGLPYAGILLCVAWALMTQRGFDNYLYWIWSARELEQHLRPPVTTVARGGAFADGDRVTFEIDNKKPTLRMSRSSRLLRAAMASYLVIAVFVGLYVLLLF